MTDPAALPPPEKEHLMTAKKAPTGTALAERPSTDLSASHLDFFAERKGQGMEHVTMNDVVMPRVGILQSLSPQLKRNNPEFIDGAQEGQIVNTATRRVSDNLNVIPVHYLRHHIEWRPNRGGFVTDHGEEGAALLEQCKRNADNYDVLPNGNLLVPTPTWYCIDLETGKEIIIPMPRTQSKPSRQWMALATSETVVHPEHGEFTPPLFFRSYKLGTVMRTAEANEWYVWTAERGQTIVELDADGSLLAKATRFRDMLMRGDIKADAASFDDESLRGGGRGDDAAM
jgi:hypothetical protein